MRRGDGLLAGPAGAAVDPAEPDQLDEDEVIGAADGPLLDEVEGPLGDGVEGVTERVAGGWLGVGARWGGDVHGIRLPAGGQLGDGRRRVPAWVAAWGLVVW